MLNIKPALTLQIGPPIGKTKGDSSLKLRDYLPEDIVRAVYGPWRHRAT